MVAAIAENTSAGMSRWRELDVKQERIRLQIETLESRNEVSPPSFGSDLEINSASRSRIDEIRSTPAYRKGFHQWLRTGEHTPELRALLTDESTGGQTLIPIGFQREIDIRLKSFAGLRQACRIITTPTGNTLNWPTADDTTNTGEFLEEGTETGLDTNDPNFGNVAFTSNLLSSKTVTVSVQLATDAFESVEGILADMFAIRLARTSEPAYLSGNGDGEPNGLLTALATAAYTGGPSGSYIVLANGANANSGAAGDTEINSIGTGDIDNLYSALDPAYQANASFMANSTTWQKLRSQLDKYGRPIWVVSLSEGTPDKIWGRPIYVNQQMSGIGASNISMICGDFRHYAIRDVVGPTMVRFNELFMQSYRLGFQMFLRTDGQLLQPAAFTVLQHRQS
jgi:HK97 family phage major capsid protein